MGGSSKKQTVGYKYYLGMHMVLCHGPIDYVKRIDVDERNAWSGFSNGGRVNINRPNLFGGEDREGGISGAVDIEMGGSNQVANSYLAARLGGNTPAFRGVVAAVLRQVYVGMNPYLKPWKFRAQRVYSLSEGEPQWYQEKAPIGEYNDTAIYIALDLSVSMNWGEQTDVAASPSRLDSAKQALSDVFDELAPVADSFQLDIMLVGWSGTSVSIMRRNVTSQDLGEIKTWLNNRTAAGATDFRQAVNDAPSFFAGAGSKPRRVIFITDGEANPAESVEPARTTLFSISEVRSYGINIFSANTSDTARMDNTPEDGVPVVSATNSAPLRDVILNALLSHIDLNPAHIVRECLVDNVWGMGYNSSDVDEDSFRLAADALYDERLGVSLLWDRQTPLEDFVQEILKHIDGVLRVNRRTGKFELKLIRNDYDKSELLTLTPDNVEKIEDFSRPSFGELINSVTVNYWDASTGTDASLSVQDIALIATQGSVINTTVQYPGVTNQPIASRLASRDLRTLSNPLVSCLVYTNRDARNLNVGDVFLLTWPDYLLNEKVMRVTSISYGDGRSHKIKIQAAEDVFSLPQAVMEDREDLWEDPSQPPLPAQDRLAIEAPYYEVLKRLGYTSLSQELVSLPELGYFIATAGKPSEGVINLNLRVDSGAGYEDVGTLDFCPTAQLEEDLLKFSTVVTLKNVQDGDLIRVGSWAYIDDELVEVVSWNEETKLLELKRGLLDTVPVEHGMSSVIFFAEDFADGDETQYVDGDSIDIKLLPVSGAGVVEESSVQPDTIPMSSRVLRPFRPANLRAFGELDPDPSYYPTYPVTVSWASRNRLQETTTAYLAWTDGNVTPEAGTEYRVLVEATQKDGSVDGIVVDVTQAGTTYSLDEATVGATWAGSPFMKVTVWALRDGWESWQAPSVQFRGPFREPNQLFAFFRDHGAPENLSGKVVG